MKAFGVRLAAGAVTILVGAIMAAQAQKQQQSVTESAWTESSIPPAKAGIPIGAPAGLGDDPIDSDNPFEQSKTRDDAAVILVQHTEAADEPADSTLSLPVTLGPPTITDTASADSTTSGPAMPMRIPEFKAVPLPSEKTSSAAAGPGITMGLPTLTDTTPPTESQEQISAGMRAPSSAVDTLSRPERISSGSSNVLRGGGLRDLAETDSGSPMDTRETPAISARSSSQEPTSAVSGLSAAMMSLMSKATGQATEAQPGSAPTGSAQPGSAQPGSAQPGSAVAVTPDVAPPAQRSTIRLSGVAPATLPNETPSQGSLVDAGSRQPPAGQASQLLMTPANPQVTSIQPEPLQRPMTAGRDTVFPATSRP